MSNIHNPKDKDEKSNILDDILEADMTTVLSLPEFDSVLEHDEDLANDIINCFSTTKNITSQVFLS